MKQEKRQPRFFIGQYVKCKFPDKAIMYGRVKSVASSNGILTDKTGTYPTYVYSIETASKNSLYFAEENIDPVHLY